MATIQAGAKKSALKTVTVFPLVMLAVYIALLLYFKSTGGYKPVELTGAQPPPRTG